MSTSIKNLILANKLVALASEILNTKIVESDFFLTQVGLGDHITSPLNLYLKLVVTYVDRNEDLVHYLHKRNQYIYNIDFQNKHITDVDPSRLTREEFESYQKKVQSKPFVQHEEHLIRKPPNSRVSVDDIKENFEKNTKYIEVFRLNDLGLTFDAAIDMLHNAEVFIKKIVNEHKNKKEASPLFIELVEQQEGSKEEPRLTNYDYAINMFEKHVYSGSHLKDNPRQNLILDVGHDKKLNTAYVGIYLKETSDQPVEVLHGAILSEKLINNTADDLGFIKSFKPLIHKAIIEAENLKKPKQEIKKTGIFNKKRQISEKITPCIVIDREHAGFRRTGEDIVNPDVFK